MRPHRQCLSLLFFVGVAITYRCCTGSNIAEDSPVAAADQLNEFCQLETMRGRCRWKSEVIVMTSARWGRMKTGRCLNIHPTLLAANGHDPLFLGCSENVLSIADKKCSGRSQCDFRMSDPELDKVTPCYPDQLRFLEASYTCVKVVQESRSCAAIATNEDQYLLSSLSMTDTNSGSTCGSRAHPWRLNAPAGQRINISLLDFNGVFAKPLDVHTCHQYGYVVETSSKKNVTICASVSTEEASVGGVTQSPARLQRDSAVYLSETNSVNIVLFAGTNVGNNNFLLKVYAVGCTNMVPPDNAWLKRSNNDIVIGCYLSQQTWQLKCDGHEWKGRVGTCPDTYVASSENHDGVSHVEPREDTQDTKMRPTAPSQVLAMIVIGGGSVIVCVVIIAIGMICLQRTKSLRIVSTLRNCVHRACKRTYKKTQIQSTLETRQFVRTANDASN